MKGSIIVYASTKEERKSRVEDFLVSHLGFEFRKEVVENPDLLFVQAEDGKNTIGISETRNLTKFINQKPFSHLNRCAVVWSAHLLTTQAQNALLKTLEEPPNYATIILESKSLGALLPTVVSRCQRIDAGKTQKKEEKSINFAKNENLLKTDKNSLNYVLSTNLGKRFEIADELAKLEKEEIVEILENWVKEGREELLNNAGTINAGTLGDILEIKSDIENTNVNTKLALERLLVGI